MKTLTVRLAAAYVENNPISPEALPDLIESIFKALSTCGEEVVAEEAPAVTVKKSISANAITCMICGKKFSMLKRHLHTDHDMTPDEYRTKWGLHADYPMTAPDYAARRSQLALKSGLGRKKAVEPPPAPVPVPAKPRRKKIGLQWEK